MKVCIRCEVSKPEDQFYLFKTGRRKGKLVARCKACDSLRHLDYAARVAKEGRPMPGLYPSIRWTILQRDGFKCRYCGNCPPEVKLQVDHIIPVSKGGKLVLENLVTACEPCNRGKNAKEVNFPIGVVSGVRRTTE